MGISGYVIMQEVVNSESSRALAGPDISTHTCYSDDENGAIRGTFREGGVDFLNFSGHACDAVL